VEVNREARTRRLIYVFVLVLVLVLWVSTGQFVAVEAPYVGF
jgi:hypothetical protein